MALNEDQAVVFAQKLLLNMAESGSLTLKGASTGSGTSEEHNEKRGTQDAAYLASLYRELVNGFQK